MQKMTIEQWDKEKKRLTASVTKARNKVAKLSSLAEKIAQKAEVIKAEEFLRKHKINYHELTSHSN
jgi:prefoldin subunit 5